MPPCWHAQPPSELARRGHRHPERPAISVRGIGHNSRGAECSEYQSRSGNRLPCSASHARRASWQRRFASGRRPGQLGLLLCRSGRRPGSPPSSWLAGCCLPRPGGLAPVQPARKTAAGWPVSPARGVSVGARRPWIPPSQERRVKPWREAADDLTQQPGEANYMLQIPPYRA